MDYSIDIERLRRDLEYDYLAIGFNVSKAALLDASNIRNLSDAELLDLAYNMGYNLDDYIINNRGR